MSTAGYARVSTDQQSLDQQRDALTAAGCERMFTDQLFGVRDDRPGLAALLDYTRAGDVVVVVALDGLGRSLSETIRTIEGPHRGRGAAALAARGHRLLHCHRTELAGIFAALAAHERELMNERAAAGPRGARARADTGRHPSSLRPKPAKSGRSASAGNRSPSSSLATAWPSTPRASGHWLKAEVDH